jgi:maltose/moltooligosaccharide transporter
MAHTNPPPESPEPSNIPLAYVTPVEQTYAVGTLQYTKATLLRMCAWLLTADIGMSFRARALGPMMQFLIKGLGASNLTIAWSMTTVPQALSLIFSPVVAAYSDRFRSRWGRRLPFIFVTVPILTLTMAAMGFSPMIGTQLHRLLGDSSPGEKTCGLITFITIFIIYDLAAIVQGRTWNGLTNDVVPHKILGRFAAAARIISLLAGIIFNQFFLAHVQYYQLPAFLILSVIFGSSMVVLALFIREGQYPPPPPRPPSRGLMQAWTGTLAFIKDCYGNPYYRWVMVMLCIDDIAFSSVNLYSLFHAQSLNMNMQTYGTCLSAQYIIGLVLAYPIGILADRFHPFRVSAVFLFLYGVGAVWSGFNIHDTKTFIIGFMLHGIFATSYNTAAASMGYRMLARSRYMILAAGQGIVGTVITMLVMPVLGYLLDASGSQYRYSYLVGAGYVLLGLPLYLIVYRKFLALGGPKNYVAPGDEIPPEPVGFPVITPPPKG